MAEPMLTAAEAAEMFGVSRETVTKWAKAGKLPAVQTPGGHWRFPAEAVRAAREAQS